LRDVVMYANAALYYLYITIPSLILASHPQAATGLTAGGFMVHCISMA